MLISKGQEHSRPSLQGAGTQDILIQVLLWQRKRPHDLPYLYRVHKRTIKFKNRAEPKAIKNDNRTGIFQND